MEKIIDALIKGKYASIKDLKYSESLGLKLNNQEVQQLLIEKDNMVTKNSDFINLELKTFNSKYIFYVNCHDLISYEIEFLRTVTDDFNEKQDTINNRHISEILLSRIYSEIEGTLNVENIPTTRKRIEEIITEKKELKDDNDIIIKNMYEGMQFILNKPEFNEENLFILYNKLSNHCLSDDCVLKNGRYYRDDEVSVDRYGGCPVDQIDECMKSLFDFVNKKNNEFDLLMPHIAHYYILYIHPYFDYNGRTARMVSLWINLLCNNDILPYIMSEAINQNKKEYYDSLRDTRDNRNDLTYFLIFILKTSIKYSLCYKDLDYIDDLLMRKGTILTTTEKHYIKSIIISNTDGYFTYKAFLKYINNDMTKQAALKFLNKFEDYDILSSKTANTREKLFIFNKNMIKYSCNWWMSRKQN